MKRSSMVLLAAALAAPAGVHAQTTTAATRGDTVSLSLGEAVERATAESEEVRLARSQVQLASTQITSARSQGLPQLSANLGYTRTLQSPFDAAGGGGFTIPDSLRFRPDSTLSLEERVRYLEQNAPFAPGVILEPFLDGFGNLGLGFGQKNAYAASLSGSQVLFSGGRIGAGVNIARRSREAAELSLIEQTAEIELQVRTAYYNALLAQELVGITEASLAQAERFLATQRARQGAGRGSELEVIRAEVSRDNLRPQLVQAQNSLDLARLNLKRLVEIPLDQPLRLTTRLTAPSADELRDAGPASELLLAQRASVQAAERQVAIREQQVRLARSAFLPSVAVQSNYARQVTPPGLIDFDGARPTGNWTVALGVSVPIFNGLARNADLARSRVELEQARTQVAQLREAVEVQYEQARLEKERARAAITARQRTTALAERAYNLTVLRFEEGVATQLDVSTSRLELNQARTNLAQAIAEFYLADAGVARAGTGGGSGGVPNAAAAGITTPGATTTAPGTTVPATTTTPTTTSTPTVATPAAPAQAQPGASPNLERTNP